MSLCPPLSAAEMRVAAERARGYPPGNSRRWGVAPEFNESTAVTARLLAERPHLWESG